jgi:hypothetical protein
MGIFSHLGTCVCTKSPKYLEMAQRHISLSPTPRASVWDTLVSFSNFVDGVHKVHLLSWLESCTFKVGLTLFYLLALLLKTVLSLVGRETLVKIVLSTHLSTISLFSQLKMVNQENRSILEKFLVERQGDRKC